MSYKSWFQSHGKKHKEIVDRLSHLSDNELIEYFRYENMVKNEPDFCPLYEDNKRCHNMENLNCYLCACPNFRFDDNGFREEEGRIVLNKDINLAKKALLEGEYGDKDTGEES